jgi:hypothetical protein
VDDAVRLAASGPGAVEPLSLMAALFMGLGAALMTRRRFAAAAAARLRA